MGIAHSCGIRTKLRVRSADTDTPAQRDAQSHARGRKGPIESPVPQLARMRIEAHPPRSGPIKTHDEVATVTFRFRLRSFSLQFFTTS
jgi:hypothetical protein